MALPTKPPRTTPFGTPPAGWSREPVAPTAARPYPVVVERVIVQGTEVGGEVFDDFGDITTTSEPGVGGPGLERLYTVSSKETLAAGSAPLNTWAYGRGGTTATGVVWSITPPSQTAEEFTFEVERAIVGAPAVGDSVAANWNTPKRITGPRGDTGARGQRGNVGPAGATGPAGPQGNPGPTGATGPKGDTGDTGPQGNPGPRGNPGPTGGVGPKGDTGDTGPQGNPGPRGNPGPTGSRGPAGAKGDTGDAGTPATSIERVYALDFQGGTAVAGRPSNSWGFRTGGIAGQGTISRQTTKRATIDTGTFSGSVSITNLNLPVPGIWAEEDGLYFAHMNIASNGRQMLLSVAKAGETGFAQRHDLRPLIEQTLTITVRVGSTIYTFSGPDASGNVVKDGVEPYVWQPPVNERSRGIALYNLINARARDVTVGFFGGLPWTPEIPPGGRAGLYLNTWYRTYTGTPAVGASITDTWKDG